MNQAESTKTQNDVVETTVTTEWPSICVYPSGKWLGKLYSIRWPDISILRIGNLLALLSIPHALLLYFSRVVPKTGIRYRLTNRRLLVERGMGHEVERSIELESFDDVQAEQLAGQAWYDAADLVLFQAGEEVFRIGSVCHPETFRQILLKTQRAYVSVLAVRQSQGAVA